MPSESDAQRRLMAAAAHTKGGYGGVPQSVGKEFNRADKAQANGGKIRMSQVKHSAPRLPSRKQ